MSLLNMGFKFTVESSELFAPKSGGPITGLVMQRNVVVSSDHGPTDLLFSRVSESAARAFASDILAAVARLEATVKSRTSACDSSTLDKGWAGLEGE